jgi:hypothetical protein
MQHLERYNFTSFMGTGLVVWEIEIRKSIGSQVAGTRTGEAGPTFASRA